MKLFNDLRKAAGLQFTLLFGFMGLAGLVCLLAAIFAFFTTFGFIRHSIVTNGTVVRLVPHSGNRGTLYSPEVEFTASGRTFQFEGNGETYPSIYHVNQAVRVRYDPSHPASAAIDTPSQVWTNFLILALFGVIFTVAPGLVFYFILRNARGDTAGRRKRPQTRKKRSSKGSRETPGE